jgi:hypothetical protein
MVKLNHRCSVIGCKKCGAVDYDKIYFCKKHNPARYFKINKLDTSVTYELKNGNDIRIINDEEVN